jgi:type II secretory pathway pseudopilin PulG
MTTPSTVDDQGSAADSGETLVELMVTIVILATTVIALVGGIGTAVTISDIHRKQASAGAYLRDYADGIQSAIAGDASTATAYTPCTGAGTKLPTSTYATPRNYTFTDQTHYSYPPPVIAYWDPDKTPTAGWSSVCPTKGDSGVQKLSLTVASKDGRATESMDIIIRRPCRVPSDFPKDTAC